MFIDFFKNSNFSNSVSHNMNKFIVIVIIILNIFLKYVLGFINNIIIILVTSSTFVNVFIYECKKSQYSGGFH